MYNREALTGAATADIGTVVCSIMDFGGHNWSGDFYVVRLYNRVLTDEEMTKNYNYDKANYPIP